MIGKKVTCIWAGQGAISMGNRYEIINYDANNGLVKVIGDDGKRTQWLLGTYFELSGEEILAIKQFEFINNHPEDVLLRLKNHICRVTVTLTDNSRWQAKFYLPKDKNSTNSDSEEVQEFMGKLANGLLKHEILNLFYKGDFYSKFEQIDNQ